MSTADVRQQEEKELPAEESSLTQRLEAIADSKVGPGQLQGVTVSIRIGAEQRWSFAKGISSAEEAMRPEMRFGIASITKTAVAATILRLEEEGRLSLKDPINKWLSLNSENIDGSITIFQLLNHLSGLKGYFQHRDIWPRVEANLDSAIPSEELTAYIGDPIFSAGERFEYSNSNYLILGLIIKAVTGKTVGEAMRTRFWDPLGLNSIYFGTDETPNGPVAAPWRPLDGETALTDISSQFRDAYHSVFFTAADIFSTAEDLSLWSYHLYAGNVLSQESREKMLNFITVDSGDPYWSGYGLGVRRFHFEGRTMWGHTGGMRGYGSYMLYDPISRLSISMLNNQSRSENGPLLRFQLVQELLKEVFLELDLK